MGIFVLLSFANTNAATITSTRAGGNWNDPATWVGGVVPSTGDDVTIASGATVVIDSDAVVGTLTVSGILQYDSAIAYALTVTEFITVNAEGVFRSAQSGSIKNHRLITHGSIINNGTIDFSSNANETGVELVFTGPGNAIFNCSDAILTNLRQGNGIILNKGKSAASVLSFIPGKAFRVLSDGSTTAKGFLTIENGTFNVIGSRNFRNPVSSADGTYTIPATGGLWLGNQNAEITGLNGDVIIQGELKITNGTFNAGTSAGNSLKTEGNGNLKISGGTTNVAGKFNVDGGVCSISGGRLNLAVLPNSANNEPAFGVSSKAKLEIFGNPLVTITYPNSGKQLANDIQIQEGSGSKFISGGVIQLGTEGTPTQSFFLVSGERIIPYLTGFSECSTVAYNTSKADVATNQVTALPRIALDKTAPEITSPSKITIKCGEMLPSAYTSLSEFTKAGGMASDNCSLNPSGFRLLKEVRSKAICPYIVTRTYEIADASGNTATAEQQIQVEGNIAEPQAEPVSGEPIAQELKLKSAMAGATITSTTTGGNWSDASSWTGGVVPTTGDNVVIVSGATVTVNAAVSCDNITIDAGGTLAHSGTNTLTVSGNWTNNGTYSGGTNGIVEFAGTSNAIVSGSTNFEELKINKGSLNTSLTINGTVAVTSGGSLTMDSGLITIPAGSNFTVNPSKGLKIEKTAGFDLIGGTLITKDFTITNEGLIRISSGTANFGSDIGNSVHTQFDGAFIVTGGTVNIAGRLENTASGTLAPLGLTSGITITGGTITLSTVGNELSNMGSLNVTSTGTFNFTGGTIVFQNPSTATTELDLGLISGGTKNTVGGTFQFGNASTPAGTVFNISSGIMLDKVTSDSKADIQLNSDVVINQLNLNSNSTFNLNGNSLRLVASSIKTYTFPIDNGSGASIPVTIDLTSGTFGPNPYIEVETFGSKYTPFNESDVNYLNRYWTITTSGITSPVYNVTATYADPADIVGTESEIAMGSWTGTKPWVKYGNVNAGTNTLSANGLTASSFTFTGITSDPPTVSVTATPATICIGSSSNLTATPVGDTPFTYLWSPTTDLSSSTIANPVATPASTTTYTVTVTDGNGFTASDATTVTVNPTPTVTSPGNQTFCSGVSTTAISLTGTPSVVTFDISGGAAVGLANQTGITSIPEFIPVTGTATVTITPKANGCTGIPIDFSVNVNSAPVINTCPSPITLSAIAGTCSATATYSITATGVPAATYTYTFAGATTGSGNGTGSGSSFNVGVTSVEVTASNTCGSVKCNFTITIKDNEAPVISGCPTSPITVNTGPGRTTCNQIASWTEPAATDNCTATGSLVWTKSHLTGATFPIGTTTVTYSVRDDGGNAATCTFTVSVLDNTPPVISSCPSNVSVFTGPGRTTCNQTATWPEPTAVDNCSGALTYFSRSHAPGSLFNVGTTTVTYTFKDASGNTETCTFTVTVIDNTPPVAPTLPNVNAQCSVTLTAPTTTDNCSGTVTVTTTSVFPYTTPGVTSIIWTFTDAAGNTSSSTQIVTINDTTSPVFTLFPGDKTLECITGLVTSPTATGTPTATDNCSTVSITYTDDITPGNCSGRYTIKRTWKASDTSGNSFTRDQLIHVDDTTPPEINCISYTNFDRKNLPEVDALAGISVSDNCTNSADIMVFAVSEDYQFANTTPGFCPTSLKRVYRAIDACGNSSECTQTYDFIFDSNCTLCPGGVNTLQHIFSTATETWSINNVTRDGNCCSQSGSPPLRCTAYNFYLHKDAVGVIFRQDGGALPPANNFYMALDECGKTIPLNSTVCLDGDRWHTVIFCKSGGNANDFSIQSITGAATLDDIITRADANCVKNITVTGLDASDPSKITWSVKYPAGANNLLSYLSCTNCLTPVFTPDVNTPPTIIYEVCGPVTGTYVCNGHPITDCAELTVTTLPAIDVSFNIDLDNICEDEIPGIDATITPGGYAYEFKWYDGPDGTGNLLSTSSTWTPTTQGDYSLVVTENQSGVSCNSSIHNFNITFDYIGPSSLTVPPPLQIDCNLPTADFDLAVATWLASATASDTNISSIPVTNDYTSFVHSCGAVKTVTFSASDNCGNTTTATSEIRIIDTTPPVITTPATNQTVECDGAGNSAALNSWLSSSAGSVATDACGGTISWTNNYTALSDLCGATGVATVTFTATDACGNASTTVATFTIVDTTPPVISCPAPVSGIANTAECFATGIVLGTATATDNCSVATVINNAPAQFPVGITTVTWTATDACGNIATCTQLVTILDNNQPPTITCPNGPYVETIAPDQCSKTGVSPGTPTIWDNCPNPVLTYVLTGVTTGSGVGVVSNTTFNVGVTTITYTVTDAGGSTNSCSFSVWIKRLDIPAATVTCTASPAPVDAVVGTCSAPVTLTSPLINDPCNSIVSVVHNSPYGTSASDASGTYPVGTTTVTWTITDNSGNVKTCTQTVVVRDMQPPSITCPADAVDQIINGGCNLLSGNVQTPTISDNCGIASLTYVLSGATNLVSSASGINYANGITYGVGVTTVTYTVTDVNGLTASCTHTVWIKNLNAPQFSSTQPANVSVPADSGVCQAAITVPSPGINNPCNEIYNSINNSPYKTSATDASGTYPVGTTTITWIVTDASGSKTTHTQTVTVVDTQTPTITCPSDVEDQIANGGCTLVSGNVQTPTISDNCGIASLTYVLSGATNLVSPSTGLNYANGITYNVGVTTVTYTVTDVNGLTASCTHTVWIKNLNAPQFDVTCRTGTEQNIVVPADSGECEADITVLSPIITNPCNEVYTITNNITGTATATGTYQVGTTTITWTIKDASGNLYTCTQTVNVVDTQTPTISCPADVEDQIINGGCNLLSGNVQTPTISDNCGIASLTYELTGATNLVSPSTGLNYANGITYNVGVTSVTYTVTDVNGLTASCTHTVWIKNLNAPKFTSTQPSNISVPADAGVCHAAVTVPPPGINNPCNELYTVVNDSPYQTSITDASGTYPIGTTTVTWVVTDASGSKTTYTQTVTVVDTQVPSFTSCPADISEPADFEKLFATNVDIPVRPTFIADNCTTTLSWTIVHETNGTVSSSVTTGINYVPTPYPQLDLGVNTVTYQLSDDSGNTSTCTFTVTITAKPVIDCPADIVTNTTASDCTQSLNPGVPELISGSQPITWTWTIVDPTGNIQASGTFSGTVPIPGGPPDLGIIVFKEGTSTITWTATNLAGTTSCTHTVTVIDNVKPTFNLPAAFSECVLRIQDAEFYAPTVDITPTRPEYYILKPGDISLDLTGLWDNCCATASLTVNWRIEFTDTTDPAAPPAIIHINPITGTGQLSTYGTPILFPGDGVTFNNVIHKIYYWLEDCHGNKTDEQAFDVTIRPRPEVIKMN